MDIAKITHNYEYVYEKVHYIYEHSGDGAIIHKAGQLAGLIYNYNRLMWKEFSNPVMGKDYWKYYANKLNEYIEESEIFLSEVANIVMCDGGEGPLK